MENQNTIKKYIPRIIIFTLLGFGAYYGYKKYHYAQTHEDTDNAQIETYFVPVLPRMAGYVKTVSVKDYDLVTKDQVLAEIDTDEAKLILDELNADYVQAQTDVENAKANISNLNITVKSAEANLKANFLRKEKAKKDADRDANLVAENAITRKQSDDSKANFEILSAQYDAGKEDILTAKSKMPILQAALHKAEAVLGVKKVKIEQQKLKLTYAKVYAPSSGRIGKKNIEAGQFIQAGQPLMTVVQDTNFWVVANFKETQVSRLVIGAEVELKLDAYPNRILKGKIVSIAESTGAKTSLLPPDNASGNFVKVTQRVPVKIEIEDLQKNKDILRAGLSLEVSVPLK
ncbi:HlyD family secretion protein [Arcicella sp. LKC2W]|uniref:HlyD family secretion protein n=1 Tax=Arcicella sp. LKC2W TaxID=2984198 RepID=UPI002B21E42F|nr:HlyD family secretion protein [Arcicella sp. LKC2W]MEA5459954.1 HlyD family secretion protein [Arcicella sp. LKC2W]